MSSNQILLFSQISGLNEISRNHCVCAFQMHLLSARPSQQAGEVQAAEWGNAGICLGWLEKGGFEEPVVDAGCLPPPQSFSPKWPPTQHGSNSANSWDLSPAAPMGVISCDPLLLVTPLLILPSSVNTHPASHPLFSFLFSSSKLKSLIRKDWILLPRILNLGCLKEGPACHTLICQSFLKGDWFRKGSNPALEPQTTDPAVDIPTLVPLTRKKKKISHLITTLYRKPSGGGLTVGRCSPPWDWPRNQRGKP